MGGQHRAGRRGRILNTAASLDTALFIGIHAIFPLLGRAGGMGASLAGLVGAVGLFSLFVLYIPGLAALGFIILPVGMGWMLAAGVTLLRRRRL